MEQISQPLYKSVSQDNAGLLELQGQFLIRWYQDRCEDFKFKSALRAGNIPDIVRALQYIRSAESILWNFKLEVKV